MKKRNITLFTAIAAAAAFASSAQAAVVLPTDAYVTGGGAYRLMFVTTATTTGTSSDLTNVYNPIAQTAGDIVLSGHTWTAVAGTSTVSARTNTGAFVVGDGASYSAAIDVPIYTTNGNRVTLNNTLLWAGSMENQLADQTGTAPGFSNDSAWGGWLAGGGIILNGGSSFGGPLGDTDGANITTFRVYKQPWDWGNAAQATELPLVSLSSVINPIPEPTSMSLLALGGLALLRRRRA